MADTLQPEAVAMYVPMPVDKDGNGPAGPADIVRIEHQVWDAETCGTLCTAADEAVARHIVSLWNAQPATQLSEMQTPVARLLCKQRDLDPDEHIIGGQATNFEDFGPRWKAARHGHWHGFHDYEEDADAILALTNTSREG